MFSRIRNTACFILTCLVLLPMQLQAQQRSSQSYWYLGAKGAVVFTANDRPASNGKLIGVERGRQFTPFSAMELEAYYSTTEFDAGFEVDQNALKINYVLTNPVPLWHPYVLFGGGIFNYRAPQERDTGLTVAVATGGQWVLSNNGLTLRAELRYRYSDAESKTPGLFKKGEPIFSLGVVLPLS